MKIYPSKHRIKQVAESNIDKDITIPLAYLDNSHVSYSITKEVHNDFSISSQTVVLPNQKIDHEDVLLFDFYGNPADSSTIINRGNDGYYYYPNNMIEFVPLKFSYNVIAQKKVTYTTSSNFNINISCIDDLDKLNFTNRLSKILVAPAKNNYLPNNISINNNETTIGILNKLSYDSTNFVFIESHDGMHYNFEPELEYMDEQIGEYATANNLISLDTFLDSNINTWIISDDHYKYPMSHGTGFNVSLKNPVITSKKDLYVKDYYNVSDLAFSNIKVHNLFSNDICPILIIEHENRGFTIYSGSEIFEDENINICKNIIYEVLMYVHCISYKTSKTVDEYITYTLPDYEVINNSLYKKNNFVSKTSLNALLNINAGYYEIRSVNIFDNNNTLAVPNEDLVNIIDDIVCIGKSNGKLVFKLNDANKNKSVYQEPAKQTGWTSIFYNNKIYYIEQLHYLVETNLGRNQDQENKLFLIEKDVDLLVRLYPFKSSKYGLNITQDLKITIPFIKTSVKGVERVKNENYVLYMNLNTKDLGFVYEDEYEESADKVYLALIIVKEIKSEQYLTDMRLRGGGLPEDMPDNFNLLDIGHIYGRPYRQANTLVITLPKKYEEYKEQILEVIDKYKVAEDYTVLFFEDDETDGEI